MITEEEEAKAGAAIWLRQKVGRGREEGWARKTIVGMNVLRMVKFCWAGIWFRRVYIGY